MNTFWRSIVRRYPLPVALLLAISMLFLSPTIAQAHAVLLRSDPAQDARLRTAPAQVRMWFSEDLNPALSTAVVLNSHSRRIDQQDAHVSPADSTEMDVSLQANLPPDIYVVVWRSVSNIDGHVLRGSFLFTVTEPDGSLPRVSASTSSLGQDVLGGGNSTSLYTGQIDAAGLFNLVMITLTELGAIFWVGAQLWRFFVLQAVKDSSDDAEQEAILAAMPQRFAQRFALPTLLGLLVTNLGVLIGQAIFLSNGQWESALSPTLLLTMITSGRFGLFWLLREVFIALALLIALYQFLQRRRSAAGEQALTWVNLLLGLGLFIAITMSSHAAAVSNTVFVYSVLIDWLHLLGSAFWIGGMFYIATCYLPLLARRPTAVAARSLTTVLPYYSPWAITGVALLTVTGPFSASFHLTSAAQLITTAYGRALAVKVALVGALMITSAVHVFLLRPRLRKDYRKYAYAAERLERQRPATAVTQSAQSASVRSGEESASPSLIRQVKLREKRLTRRTQRLMGVLRWEPLLGLAVLVCVGLMNVFGGTLTPTTAAAQTPPTAQQTQTAKPLTASARTSDGKFTVTLTVNPNRFGSNTFTVKVIDNRNQRPTTQVGVTLYLTMLDMDMGISVLNLQPDSSGGFSGHQDLSMSGDWQAQIQIRTLDNTLHEAQIKFYTPF
jgi:copper transport protein